MFWIFKGAVSTREFIRNRMRRKMMMNGKEIGTWKEVDMACITWSLILWFEILEAQLPLS